MTIRHFNCVVSIILFYCARSSPSLPDLVFTIPRWTASDGSPTTANEKEQNRKHRCWMLDVAQFYGTCLSQCLCCHLRQDINHILITPFFIFVKHNMSHDSQLTMLIILSICFCTEVCVLVFQINALVCAFRGLCCQKNLLKLYSCLWSPTFLNIG